MPFTLTHIAATVPVALLARWKLPFTALAIGSMLPDISGFFPGFFDAHRTHSFLGVLTHCLPIGVVAYYVFHWILKQPLVQLLPVSTSRRLQFWARQQTEFTPTALFTVIGCILFGSLTHVCWDAFTHRGVWGVRMCPSLLNTVFQINDHPVRWYSILQHGSSIVFLPPLLFGFVRWTNRQPQCQWLEEPVAIPRSYSWSVIGLLTLVAIYRYCQIEMENPKWIQVHVLRITVRDMGAVVIVAGLVYCLVMQFYWWRQNSTRLTTSPSES